MTSALDPSFRVDQPRANDIVGDQICLAGMGGGFEGTIQIRILDADGAEVLGTHTTGSNLTSAWQGCLEVPSSLTTTTGVVEIGPGTGKDQHPGMVSIPVFFGTRIVENYHSHLLYTVQHGDTLSSIAADQAPLYVGSGWQPIFEANRHIIADPNVIHPGTVLRLVSDF